MEGDVEGLRQVEVDRQLHVVPVAQLDVAEGAVRQGVVQRVVEALQGVHIQLPRTLVPHIEDVQQVGREALVERDRARAVGGDGSGAGCREATLNVLGQYKLQTGLGRRDPDARCQVEAAGP